MSNVDLTAIMERIRNKDHYLKKNGRMISKKKMRLIDGALITKTKRDEYKAIRTAMQNASNLVEAKTALLDYMDLIKDIFIGNLYD